MLHKPASIIPKTNGNRDYFKDFNGFAPEGKYEYFLRTTPAQYATMLLKFHRGKKVEMTWYPVNNEGVGEIKRTFLVSYNENKINCLLNGVVTDQVRLNFITEKIRPYILQRIVNRDQSVTQVDRNW